MRHGKSLLIAQWLKIYYNIFFATGSLTAKQLERLPCSPNLTIFEALPTISILRGSWASKLAECHSFLPSLETNAGRKTALSGQMELCWSLLAGLCWSVSWECIDHDGQETDCGRSWKRLLKGWTVWHNLFVSLLLRMPQRAVPRVTCCYLLMHI